MDENLKKVVDKLCVKNTNGSYLIDGAPMSLKDILEFIRRTLGISRMCSKCHDWKFDYELSLIGGSDELVCQGCAEQILNGERELEE